MVEMVHSLIKQEKRCGSKMALFKKKEKPIDISVTTKKPKKWKDNKDWKKMDKYIKKHKLNYADFED